MAEQAPELADQPTGFFTRAAAEWVDAHRDDLCACPWWLRWNREWMHTDRCSRIAALVEMRLVDIEHHTDTLRAERDEARRESAEHLALIDGDTAADLIRSERLSPESGANDG